MEIQIKYAGRTILSKLPDKTNIDIFQPNEMPVLDADKTIQTALRPNNDPPDFQDFVENHNDFMIIVNDDTRSTPTAKILSHIDKSLVGKDFKFMVAAGTHRAPTESELETIFGDYLEKYRDRIIIHDSRDEKNLAKIGTSPSGNDFWINKHAFESGALIIIGSVEPHYFAGFSGGRKSILPGIAGYETIRHNHSNAMNDYAKVMTLKGNYIHEEMELAAKSVNLPIYSIQAVLDRQQNIYRITAGDIVESFYEAVEFAKEVFAVEYTSLYDIVIAEVNPPMDIDLYQSHKALEHVKAMCKKDGIIILVSECKQGIGQSNFYSIVASGKSSKVIRQEIDTYYKLGSHKSYKLAKLLENKRIWAYTEIVPELLRKINIRPIDSLEHAIDEAIEDFDYDVDIALVKDATATVPQKHK